MERLTAKDFAPELLELYDYYAHGKINRREFLDRAALFSLGGLTAGALLASLSPDYALATQIEFTDPDIIPNTSPTLPPRVMGRFGATWCVLQKLPAKYLAWWWRMRIAV
ncbi:Dienelactone hydrolase protein [Pseudomonas coronafaciens pv. atropurpurea]|nr:Dienelactone hydrolase family protein [Pseudomonas coronafaciens pv. atropurpurea]RMT60774.1 Dienelactone hydrolase protein [Pseudomonas coronafaciens pv. atropurpurea]